MLGQHSHAMSTYNAFYVRKQAPDDVTRAAIVNLYPKASIEISTDFVGGVLSRDDFEPPEQKLAELSAKLDTDVIWVTFQSNAGSFIFHHWRAGTQMRALWYGCANEGTWDRVEGEPEPWERDAFWGRESLECLLEFAETDGEKERLQKLWKSGVLVKGQTEPLVSSNDAVWDVMEHFGLYADKEAQESQPPSSPVANSPAPPQKRFWSRLFGG
jgi:hypothetical protein